MNYTQVLGPLNIPFTYAGSIQAEIQAKIDPLITVYKTMRAQTFGIVASTTEIVAGLRGGQSQLLKFREGIDNIYTNIKKWLLDNNDTVENSWIGMTITLLIICWIILSSLIATTLVLVLRVRTAAKFHYFAWGFLGFSSFLAFGIAMVLIGASVVTDDYCTFAEDLITPEGLGIL